MSNELKNDLLGYVSAFSRYYITVDKTARFVPILKEAGSGLQVFPRIGLHWDPAKQPFIDNFILHKFMLYNAYNPTIVTFPISSNCDCIKASLVLEDLDGTIKETFYRMVIPYLNGEISVEKVCKLSENTTFKQLALRIDNIDEILIDCENFPDQADGLNSYISPLFTIGHKEEYNYD